MSITRSLGAGWLLLVVMGLVCSRIAAAEPAAKQENQPAALIDASKYPNLQAAFDALPEAGGVVKLPPGDFKLTEPLVLRRGETRVEGAGAATRLINYNQAGKPALIVRPPNLEKNPKARI